MANTTIVVNKAMNVVHIGIMLTGCNCHCPKKSDKKKV